MKKYQMDSSAIFYGTIPYPTYLRQFPRQVTRKKNLEESKKQGSKKHVGRRIMRIHSERWVLKYQYCCWASFEHTVLLCTLMQILMLNLD